MELSGVNSTTLYSSAVARPAAESPAPVTPPASQSAAPPANEKLPSESHVHAADKAASSADDKTAKSDEQQETASGLTQEELQQVEQLETRDREVRQHEQAHASVGGQYTGAPQLDYTRGPDGRLYATSGEVSVDTSAIPDDPQATIEKMQTVIRAALAPVEPSSQDRQVAAKAQAILAEAMAEVAQGEETQKGDDEDSAESAEEALGVARGDQSRSALDTAPDKATENKNGMDNSEALAARAPQSEGPLRSFSEQQLEDSPLLGASVESLHKEMERRLVDTGVFTKVFPEGSLVQQQV